jgi:CheY-like chemotaxis protein
VALLPSASVWLASEDEETRRFRVLLVEDNMLVAEAIASLLNDAGHQVTTAADAEEGWALLRPQGEAFDLVISDLNLPGMSGGELLETIVKHEITLPVILITGFCEEEEIAALMKLGAKALLKKPVQPRELLDFIAYYAQEGSAKTGANPSLS